MNHTNRVTPRTKEKKSFFSDKSPLFVVSLCLCASVVGAAEAAPPSVASLFPAGARRGTTAEISAVGSIDKSTKFWASDTGVTVDAGKEKGKLSIKIAADATPGIHWIRAYNADGASPLRPFLIGTLPEINEKEPNDDFKKPHVLNGNSLVINGKLAKSGDVDCFAVNLKKRQTLVAALEANRTLKSPMDGILQILSADGFVLDQNNDFHGLDPQAAYSVPKDGTYIVRVFAFPAAPDSSIRFSGADTYIYRLTLTTQGFADYAMPLAVGSNSQEIEFRGWNRPANPSILPDARQARDGRIAVSHPGFVNAVRMPVERHRSIVPDSRKPEIFHPPISLSSVLDKPGQENAFLFAGKKGQALSIQVESQAFGLAVNPVVRILDAERKQLARAEPGKLHGDTALSFTPPADGGYTVAVADLYAGGGPRHAFLLRVVAPEPDFELTVAADRFAIPPGKPLAIPVKVVRKNGFKKPIEVVAEGLPAGVKFAVKLPAGKADPNAITVALSAEKAGPSGAFRLVGKVKDDPASTRTAQAPLPEFETTTADLWIAVSDTPVSQPPKKKRR